MLFVELVGLNIGGFACYLAGDLVLLADDGGPRKELFEVVDNCILDMDISLGEDICAACAFTFLMSLK